MRIGIQKLDVIEKIINEGTKSEEDISSELKSYLVSELEAKKKLSTEKLLEERYNKFRKIGA